MVHNLLQLLGNIIKDLVVKIRLIINYHYRYSNIFFYFTKDIPLQNVMIVDMTVLLNDWYSLK
jgi:hypothetical protein